MAKEKKVKLTTKQLKISAKQKNAAKIALTTAIIVGQVAYLLTVRQSTIDKIAELTDIKYEMATVLKAQENRLYNISDLRYELEMTKSQTASLINIIPNATSTINEFLDLMNFMDLHNFKNVEVVQVGTVDHVTALTSVVEKQYTVSYVAPYSDSKAFISNLNQSSQLVAIKGCTIDTAPQNDALLAENLQEYGSKRKEIVQTNLNISLYMVAGDTSTQEPYNHSFFGVSDPDNVFFVKEGINAFEILEEETKNYQSIEQGKTTPEGSTPVVDEVDNSYDTYFALELWDVLASGDNYSLVSPGSVDSVYTGMRTSKDMVINLSVTDNGYIVSMKDATGVTKSNTIAFDVKKPMLNIVSNMVQVQAIMPTTKIYISNKSSDTLKISLKGSLLDTISIYTEQGTPITKDSTGNIRLV